MTATLVTGGLGFVGRYIVAALRSEGRSVVSYNRDFSRSDDDGVVAAQGELFDVPRLVSVLRENTVDAIIHTAGLSHPRLSVDLPITTFAANVDGTLHLLEAARMAGVGRVVNFSSECVYGHHEQPIDETARLRPTTPYGVSKVTTELLGHVYTRRYGVDVVSLRVSHVYGPGNPMPETIKEMLQTGIAGGRYALATGADQRLQLIHVEDVAAAATAAAWCDARDGIYNITGGTQVTLGELAELIGRRFPAATLVVGRGVLEDADQQGRFDITAAQRDLGWSPGWRLEDGIEAYAQWLESEPR